MQRRIIGARIVFASAASLVGALALAFAVPAVAQESPEWLFKNSFNPIQCQGGLPKTSAADLKAQIEAQDLLIDGLQKEIKKIGFDKRAEDFKEWDELSKAAKDEFEEKALDAIIDNTMAGAQKGLNSKAVARLKSVTPFNQDKMIAELRKAGKSNKKLEDAIRAIGKTKGKPKLLKAAKSGLKEIDDAMEEWENYKDFIDVVGNLASGEDKLETAKTMLNMAVNDPTLKLLITDLEFTTASLYNNAARRTASKEVDRLTDMNENGLLTLKRLQCQMEKAVKTKHAAQAKAATLSKPVATPAQAATAAPAPKAAASGGGPGVGAALGVGAAALAGVGAWAYLESAAPDCSAQETAMNNAANSLVSASNSLSSCGSNVTCINSRLNTLNSGINSLISAAGNMCICMGATPLDASDKAMVKDLFAQMQAAGQSPGSLPSCFR